MSVRRGAIAALCLCAVLAMAGMDVHADDGRRGRGNGNGPPQSRGDDRARDARREDDRRDEARRDEARFEDARGRSQRQRDALAESIREASRRGQVLSAESVPYDGRSINRVKVIDERGRVRVYMDDPQSGRSMRRTRGDDD